MDACTSPDCARAACPAPGAPAPLGGAGGHGGGACAGTAELLRRLSSLPPLPQAALKALQALRDDALGLEDCAQALERDAALAACTLRLANSSFYGVAGRVMLVQDAIAILGRRTTANLVATVMVSNQLTPARVPGFDFQAFWCHAIATALAAQALARQLRQDESSAFIAGLLHDMGRLAMAVLWPQAMERVLELHARGDMPLDQAEQQVMGMGHAALGQHLALHWRLPQTVAWAIGQHHGPFDAGVPLATLGHTVHLADSLVRVLDVDDPGRQALARLAAPAAAYVALQGARLLPVLGEIQSGVASISRALGLNR